MRGSLRLALLLLLVGALASSSLAQNQKATITAERGPSLRVSTTPKTRVAVALATALDPSGRNLSETDLLLAATREQPSLRGLTDDAGEIIFRIPLDPALTARLPETVWAQAARLSDGDREAFPLSTPMKVQLAALGRGDVATDRVLSRFLGLALILVGVSLSLSLLAPAAMKRVILTTIAAGSLGLSLWFLAIRPPWGPDDRGSVAMDVDILRAELGDDVVEAWGVFARALPSGTPLGVVGPLSDRQQLLLRVLAPRHGLLFSAAAPDPASDPKTLWCFLTGGVPSDWKTVSAPKPLRVARRGT